MKILQLRFKNINSLAGEHVVDFCDGPLATSAIFAIVGPTGSGKSTLLDVITLALYGKVPRLGSVTDSQVATEGSIVTHHRTAAIAEVTYGSRGQTYISSWSIRQARTGKWQAAKMELAQGTEVIQSKKSDVPKDNKRIIGLTYEQFVKAIVLSQGQFAAFLKAKKDERAKLLEDITGAVIYRQLGSAVYTRYTQAKSLVSREEQRHEDIEVLDEEVLATLEARYKEAQGLVEERERSVKHLNEQQQVKQTIIDLRARQTTTKAQLDRLEVEAKAHEADKAKLAAHDKLSSLVEPYQAYQQSMQALVRVDQQMARLTTSLKDKKTVLATTTTTLATTLSIDPSAGDLVASAQEIVAQARRLDADLEQLRRQGSDARLHMDKTIASHPTSFQQQLKAVKDPQQALTVIHNAIGTIDKEAIAAIDVEEVTKVMEGLRNDIALLQEVKSTLSQISSASDLLAAGRERAAKAATELESIEVNLTARKQSLKQVQTTLSLLQKQKMEHTAIASLEDRRAALVEDEPCPLCGSTDHPYKVHAALAKYLELDTQIAQAETAQRKAEEALLKVEQQRASVTGAMQSSQEQEKTLSARLETLQQDIRTRVEGRPAWSDLNQDLAQDLINQSQQEVQAITEQVKASKLLDYLQNCEDATTALQAVMARYKEVAQARRTLVGTLSVDGDIMPQIEDILKATETIDTLHRELTTVRADRDLAAQQVTTTQQASTVLALQLGHDSLDTAVTHLLPLQEAAQLRQRIKAVDDQLIKVRSEMETVTRDLDLATTKDKDPETDIATITSNLAQASQELREQSKAVGQLSQQIKADADSRRRRGEILAKLASLTKVANDWSALNTMIGDSTGNKFSRIAQELTLRNLIALANRRLDGLTDRYLIDMPDGSDYLRVIDRYQGDVPRSVITLSGGETFLLSLALALSLSDMASQSVELQSLFIDEGFGTLDQDTLETALSTLERLQSESSKTIGVISHVTALKERINTQIVLHKTDTGVSTLTIGTYG